VDFIVHAGDLYERPRPSPAAERVAAEGLDAWCGVAPVVVLLGNHDRPHGEDAHALAPLANRRPGRLRVADGPHPLVAYTNQRPIMDCFEALTPETRHAWEGLPDGLAIFPIPYPSRSYLAEVVEGGAEAVNAAISEALQRVLTRHAIVSAELRKAGTRTLLLGHGTLRGASYRPHQTVPLADIQIGADGFDQFDAVAWGHLHQRQGVTGWSDEVHGYVGSPDRHDFGEEGEPKGVTIFDLDEVVTHRFVPYPGAREFLTLDLAEFEQTQDIAPAPAGPIVRVTGEADAATYQRVSERVRQMKGRGVLIRNDLDVQRESRVRVEPGQPILGMEAAVAAACDSRPDLAGLKDAILANVAELRQAGGVR
jgi:DNA repair exonuclease SbcCD nuclease subunit